MFSWFGLLFSNFQIKNKWKSKKSGKYYVCHRKNWDSSELWTVKDISEQAINSWRTQKKQGAGRSWSSKPSSDQKPGCHLLLFFPHLLISSPPHQHIPLTLPSTHNQNLTISHHHLLSGLLQHPPKRSLLLPLQSILSTAIRVTLLKCWRDHSTSRSKHCSGSPLASK